MAVYILLVIWAWSVGLLKPNNSSSTRKKYLVMVFGAILFVSMLRDQTVGTDLKYLYSGYYPMFRNASWDSIQNVTRSGHWEWGFCALCKILCYISTDVRCFIIATSILSVVPYAIFIYRNSEDVVFSTIFYLTFHVFTIGLNLVRQPIAIGIVLLGLEELKQKRYIRFICIVLFASLFHTSALVALILVLVDHLKYTRNSFIWLTFVTVIATVGYSYIFEFLVGNTGLSETYSFYTVGVKHAAGYVTFHTLAMFAITAYVLILTMLYSRKEHFADDKIPYVSSKTRIYFSGAKIIRQHNNEKVFWSDSILVYATYMAVIFRIGAFIINVSSRMSYYFIPFIMVAYPHILNKIPTASDRKIIKILMYVALIVFFVYIGFFHSQRLWGVVPYKLSF